MGPFVKTTATLRLVGEDLDPDEITRLLRRRPTRSSRKGEPIFDRRGKQKGVTSRGSWRFEANERKPGDLGAQIGEIFEVLNDDLDVWRDLTARFEADLFCGLFMHDMNETLVLAPKTLDAMAARGVELSLDVYDSGSNYPRWKDGEFVGNGSDYD